MHSIGTDGACHFNIIVDDEGHAIIATKYLNFSSGGEQQGLGRVFHAELHNVGAPLRQHGFGLLQHFGCSGRMGNEHAVTERSFAFFHRRQLTVSIVRHSALRSTHGIRQRCAISEMKSQGGAIKTTSAVLVVTHYLELALHDFSIGEIGSVGDGVGCMRNAFADDGGVPTTGCDFRR